MNNQDDEKLTKLAIVDKEEIEEEDAWTRHMKKFMEDSDLIKGATLSAGISTAVAAAGAATAGVVGALKGVDAQQLAAASGWLATGLAVGTNVNIQDVIVKKVGKNKIITDSQDKKLWAFVGGATLLCGGLGAGVGKGAHKLTTSIINHLQPKHQIEQTVEVEPRPVIDEIQVEK